MAETLSRIARTGSMLVFGLALGARRRESTATVARFGVGLLASAAHTSHCRVIGRPWRSHILVTPLSGGPIRSFLLQVCDIAWVSRLDVPIAVQDMAAIALLLRM